ncbi:hypothetical protein N9234_03965, partial [Akkermansiaceae bacterium]|nr:hypothetical protein [Akkermansiaceae bacterium]
LGAAGSYVNQKKLGEAADSLRSAGDRAYARGQYRPYGVTSGAGTASFNNGQASYTMDPRYRAQQDQMFGLGTSALERAGGSYDDLATQMYNRQRAIGADRRGSEAQALGERMFGSGTRGLSVSGDALGMGEGSGMFNPQALGFSQAYAQQDAIDRNNAFNQAQQQRDRDIAIGTGMFSQGQAMDDNAMAMLGLGGNLGQQRAAAANQAGQNMINAYGTAGDFYANQGAAQAGGYQGLGTSLGGFGNSLIDAGKAGWNAYNNYKSGPAIGGKIAGVSRGLGTFSGM